MFRSRIRKLAGQIGPALCAFALTAAFPAATDAAQTEVTVRWQQPGSFTVVPAGRLLILKTKSPLEPTALTRLRGATSFVDDVRLNQAGTMLILRLKDSIRVRHRAMPDKRGMRFLFAPATPKTPAKGSDATLIGGPGQLAQVQDRNTFLARMLVLRLPRGGRPSSSARALMAFNWAEPVSVTYRVSGKDVVIRFRAASQTQTASIESAFRVAGFVSARQTNGNRLSFRLSFDHPVRAAVQQTAGRLTIGLQRISGAKQTDVAAVTRAEDHSDDRSPFVDLESLLGGHDLVISTERPTRLAAFRLRDSLWVVVPGKIRLDPRALTRRFGGAVKGLALNHYDNASVIRIMLKGDPEFAVRRTKQGWRIGIAVAGAYSARHWAVSLRSDRSVTGGALVLPVPQSGPPIRLRDPDTGAKIVVIPSMKPGLRVRVGQRFVRFNLLRSLQGVAVVTRSKRLSFQEIEGQWRITHPDGLRLSQIPPAQ